MGYKKYEYQVVKLDKQAYYPRADDPMKMVSKEWEKAMLVSRLWHTESMRKAYFNGRDDVAKQVRPMIVADKRLKGAIFSTPEQVEGVPYGDNESDIAALEHEYQRRYKQATLDNTSNRVKMMLGMLGDVQVIDREDNTTSIGRYMYSTNYKLFRVKDCTLILFEPEGAP